MASPISDMSYEGCIVEIRTKLRKYHYMTITFWLKIDDPTPSHTHNHTLRAHNVISLSLSLFYNSTVHYTPGGGAQLSNVVYTDPYNLHTVQTL